MGCSPSQDFVFGCYLSELEYDEEKFESMSEAIGAFCEEHGFEFAEGGSAVHGGSGEFVIGFKMPLFNEALGEGEYFGGFYVSQLHPDRFMKELKKLKDQMTHDKYDALMKFTGSEHDPVFWTISSEG